MTVAIDIGIVLGICLSLLKGYDFVLLPEQQAQVQQFFDQLTGWFDDVTVGSITKRIREPSIQAFLLVCACIYWTLFVMICFIPYYLWPDVYVGTHPGMPLSFEDLVGLYWGSLIAAYLAIFLLWHWPIRYIVDWTIGCDTSKKIKRRGAIVAAGSWGLVILGGILTIVISAPKAGKPYHVSDAMMLFVFSPINALFIAGYTIAVASGITADIIERRKSLLVRVLLKTSKALLWRIVLYKQGATAALVLLATIALSVARVLV